MNLHYAVAIGRPNNRYIAVGKTKECNYQPILFCTKREANDYKKKILSYCGHKDVYVIPMKEA